MENVEVGLNFSTVFRTTFKCYPLLLIMSENNDDLSKKKNFSEDLKDIMFAFGDEREHITESDELVN